MSNPRPSNTTTANMPYVSSETLKQYNQVPRPKVGSDGPSSLTPLDAFDEPTSSWQPSSTMAVAKRTWPNSSSSARKLPTYTFNGPNDFLKNRLRPTGLRDPYLPGVLRQRMTLNVPAQVGVEAKALQRRSSSSNVNAAAVDPGVVPPASMRALVKVDRSMGGTYPTDNPSDDDTDLPPPDNMPTYRFAGPTAMLNTPFKYSTFMDGTDVAVRPRRFSVIQTPVVPTRVNSPLKLGYKSPPRNVANPDVDDDQASPVASSSMTLNNTRQPTPMREPSRRIQAMPVTPKFNKRGELMMTPSAATLQQMVLENNDILRVSSSSIPAPLDQTSSSANMNSSKSAPRIRVWVDAVVVGQGNKRKKRSNEKTYPAQFLTFEYDPQQPYTTQIFYMWQKASGLNKIVNQLELVVNSFGQKPFTMIVQPEYGGGVVVDREDRLRALAGWNGPNNRESLIKFLRGRYRAFDKYNVNQKYIIQASYKDGQKVTIEQVAVTANVGDKIISQRANFIGGAIVLNAGDQSVTQFDSLGNQLIRIINPLTRLHGFDLTPCDYVTIAPSANKISIEQSIYMAWAKHVKDKDGVNVDQLLHYAPIAISVRIDIFRTDVIDVSRKLTEVICQRITNSEFAKRRAQRRYDTFNVSSPDAQFHFRYYLNAIEDQGSFDPNLFYIMPEVNNHREAIPIWSRQAADYRTLKPQLQQIARDYADYYRGNYVVYHYSGAFYDEIKDDPEMRARFKCPVYDLQRKRTPTKKSLF